MTLERRPKEATQWSTRLMGKASGLNQTAVLRIRQAFGLQPQDNYGTHKSPTARAWFARHPRFHLHFHTDLRFVAQPRRALVRDSQPASRSAVFVRELVRQYTSEHT